MTGELLCHKRETENELIGGTESLDEKYPYGRVYVVLCPKPRCRCDEMRAKRVGCLLVKINKVRAFRRVIIRAQRLGSESLTK